MVKNKKNRKGIMYSTNPNFEFVYENEKMDTLVNNQSNDLTNVLIVVVRYFGGKFVLYVYTKLLAIP